jgi:hypothetical protein
VLVAGAPDARVTEPGWKSKPSLPKALVSPEGDVEVVLALVAAVAGWCAFASTPATTKAALAATASAAFVSEARFFAACKRPAVVMAPLEPTQMNLFLCGDQRSL